MHRTTIMLPEELKLLAEREAKRQGFSLGEFIRHVLGKELKRSKKSHLEDSIFSDTLFFSGGTKKDLSVRHDDYLYGNDA